MGLVQFDDDNYNEVFAWDETNAKFLLVKYTYFQ